MSSNYSLWVLLISAWIAILLCAYHIDTLSRHVEKLEAAAGQAENSERAARGWLACDIERASLQQCCDVSKKPLR